MSSHNPHDALFRAVLADPEHARGALRAALPPPLARAIDWAALAREPGSFVDPRLDQQHVDLLFSARWRTGGDLLVYLLFEHQSTSDPHMAFRLLRYMLRIWERWRADRPTARSLPLVIPVVLYHGEASWSAPRSLVDLLDVPDDLRATVAERVVELAYVVDDLSAVPDDALRARAMTAVARLALLCLKHARSRDDLGQRLAGWADLLREVLAAPRGLDALAVVMRYILVVDDRTEPEALAALLEQAVGPAAKETIMTAGERLIQQGIEQGLQQGIEQGLREGKTSLLLLQMRKRFGAPLDPAVEQRVIAAPLEQLDRWSMRILDAPSLDALLAD